MKSFASVALFGAALVAAAPLNEKRDIIWHTTWTEVTETVMATTTKWVAPGSEISAAAANPGGDFHETAVHYSQKPHSTPSEFSFSSYGKPSYETPAPPAPTTSEAAAPVPTTSSTEESTSTPATTSTPPPPPPPAPTTPSSTYVPPPTTSVYVAPTPTSTYVAPPPPSTTSVYVAPTPTSTYVAPPPPTTTTTPAAATSTPASYTPPSSGSGSSSSGGSATYTNVELTFYTPGMGSCGITSSDSEAVVAVAAGTMTKTYSGNPNLNPLCGKKVSITANGVTKSATVVDTCPGCNGSTDLDLSPSLFQAFADESVGRITGASWSFE